MSNNCYDIFIPTRNSGKWIESFLIHYRKLGLDPLYVIDSRTSDDTFNILKRMDARFVLAMPKHDYVESGMIEAGCKSINSEWALRLDDDEFPSNALIHKLPEMSSSKFNFWGIPRRDLSYRNKLVYSRSAWTMCPIRRDSGKIDFITWPHFRFFRIQGLNFINQVHSPGVVISDDYGVASDNDFFVHCQNILLDPNIRLAKVIKYAQHHKISAWENIEEYLPEVFDPYYMKFSSDGLNEFTSLLLPFCNNLNYDPPELTPDQIMTIFHAISRALSAKIEECRCFV